MSAAEILTQIRSRPPADYRELMDELREEMWDEQINADAQGGKLDALWRRAEADLAAGRCRPLDDLFNDRS